ncbi:MAG TPA: DUF3341 domain-containing protein [Anaerolineae bacterium]
MNRPETALPLPEDLSGLMAEFEDEEAYLAAVERTAAEGYTHMDAFSPFPVEGAAEAMGMKRTRIPLIVLLGGIAGLVGGYLLQYWVASVAYPLNIGGRPLNSWPYFVPITYEVTILFASFAGLLGMLALNRLPEPYHPVFNVPEFARASQDRFFVLVGADDPQFDYARTKAFLESLKPGGVYDVCA